MANAPYRTRSSLKPPLPTGRHCTSERKLRLSLPGLIYLPQLTKRRRWWVAGSPMWRDFQRLHSEQAKSNCFSPPTYEWMGGVTIHQADETASHSPHECSSLLIKGMSNSSACKFARWSPVGEVPRAERRKEETIWTRFVYCYHLLFCFAFWVIPRCFSVGL